MIYNTQVDCEIMRAFTQSRESDGTGAKMRMESIYQQTCNGNSSNEGQKSRAERHKCRDEYDTIEGITK